MKRIAATVVAFVIVTMLLVGCIDEKLEQIIIPEMVELAVNSTHLLPVKITPIGIATPNLVWTSENEAIVSVNEKGMLTAHSPGGANIMVTCGGISAQTKVTVFVPVESVNAPEELVLAVGETVDLNARYLPCDATDAELEFVSADMAVATVDAKGCVMAHAKGDTLITVAAGGKFAITRIMVYQPVREVMLDKTEALLTVGYSFILNVTLFPEDADDGLAYSWSSEDPSVATVDATGTVRAVASGTTVITLSTENGCQASCRVEVRNPASASTEVPAGIDGTVPTTPNTSAPPSGEDVADNNIGGEGAGYDLGAAVAVGAEYAKGLGFVVHTSPGGYSYPAPYVPLPGATQAQADAAVASMVSHAFNMVTRGGELPFYEGTEIFIYESGGLIFVAY